MEFATGDIITTTIKNDPFFNHKAIILVAEGKVSVAHNSPSNKNSSGGNVVIETMQDFLRSGRSILKKQSTALTYQHILNAVEEVKSVRFHVTDFNCHDFIHYVRTGKRRKPMSVQLKKVLNLPSIFRMRN